VRPAYSSVVRGMIDYLEPVLTFIGDEMYEQRVMRPGACDFRFGNPQEMPLPEIQRALVKWAAPQNKDWFAYKFSEPKAVRVAVESLRERVGIEFDPADIAMTTGAFGALSAALRAVVDPGDEVIYLSPPWFFYAPMILQLGAKPVRVDFTPSQFELPVDAIEWHITPQTRAIIVNSPHNPRAACSHPTSSIACPRCSRPRTSPST
jgi:aspartate aminotransferase